MAVRLNFDIDGNLELPTLILSYRSGKKILPPLSPSELVFFDGMNEPSEFTFNIYKTDCSIWDKIKDFRLIWVAEWDRWYEITVDVDESNEIVKSISASHLTEAELSQLKLYTTEINTEADIAREDYKEPTIFYNDEKREASLLHRITTKAVNLTFGHIDDSLKKIQRTFTFDNTSIYDAFQEIAEEIHCLFVFDSFTDESGKIVRRVSAYDLESNCRDCGYRGEFTSKCPKCNSISVYEGYGDDTSVFLSTDNGLNQVTYTTNVDSVKNCFKLETGDDLMTAAVINCNPNGSSYIWYVTEESKEDMSEVLVNKLNSYDALYQSYINDYIANVDVTAFNKLIEKYKIYNDALAAIQTPIKGYQNLMNAYFETIDLSLYLESGLMPSVKMSDTTAQLEAEKLNTQSLSPVSVQNIKSLSSITAKNAVLAMANILVDFRYKVTAVDGFQLNGNTWSGSLVVTNEADSEDTFTTGVINVSINGDYESYLKQQIDKNLAKGDNKDYSISGLFKLEQSHFVVELRKYSSDSLEALLNMAQGCLNILIEQGIADGSDKAVYKPLYDKIYVPYFNKVGAIEAEIKVRESELDIIYKLQDEIEKIRESIQKSLNFENYLGADLWKEFSSFRREDTYSNDNFISDGLSNNELFKHANEFINTAMKEIIKSATLQHSITSTLKNILVMDSFKPIIQHFSVGNWIRVQVDEQVYKLRLLDYELDFDDYENLSVTFSDVSKINDVISDTESILNSAKSMSTSYDSVERQASKGEQTYQVLDGWTQKGLDATTVKIMNSADSQDIVYDSNGLLCRRKSDFTDGWDPVQLKIVNSTMAITDDNWKSVKTAVGRFYWLDPVDGQLKEAYGINAEVLIGRLILGEELGIYNSEGNLKFNKEGFFVNDSSGKPKFSVTSNGRIEMNADKILLNATSDLTISNGNFTIDKDGNVKVNGHITAKTGTIGGWNIGGSSIYRGSENFGQKGVMYFGANGLSINDTFKVTSGGALSAIGANINGIITATEIHATQKGQIACWTINSNSMYRGNSNLGQAGGMYFGVNGLSIGSNFIANANGSVKVEGEIIATSIKAKKDIYLYVDNSQEVGGFKSALRWEATDVSNLIIGQDFSQIYLAKYCWFNDYANFMDGVSINPGENGIYINGVVTGEPRFESMWFTDWSGVNRRPVASATGAINQVAMLSSNTTGIRVTGKHGVDSPDFTVKTLNFDSSDIRLKKNISDCNLTALPLINAIKLHEFDWKNTESHQKIGFIADELEELDPHLTIGGGYDENGYMDVKSVDSFYLLGYLTKAVQEMSTEIFNLKQQIKNME